MQKLSKNQMKEASKSLASASDKPQSSDENLNQAEKQEQETLDKLQEMQKKPNKGLDDLQALTLAQRLRKVGGREKDIEAQLQKHIPESIGLSPTELPPKL